MPEALGEGGGGELGAPTNKLQQESGGTVLTGDRVGVSGRVHLGGSDTTRARTITVKSFFR